MKIFAVSDLHLSGAADKPMDVFGKKWENHFEKIKTSWLSKVSPDDAIIIAGDLSWAMKTEDAFTDIDAVNQLPGKKVFLKGNHDYWWNSVTRLREQYKDCFFIQNDAFRIENCVFFGTRGWNFPGSRDYTVHDSKIYNRELLRLQMSADRALKEACPGDRLIAVMHYPPIESKGARTEFSDIIESTGADSAVFGHFHGLLPGSFPVIQRGDTKYYLTSCDYLDFSLIEI